MNTLQFIVDMKWAFFALLLLVFLAVAIWKMKPDTRKAFRAALMTRGLKIGLPGGFAVDWPAAPLSEEAVARAVAPDEQLAETVASSETETAEEQVQQIRREAVEQIMREAAEWGWSMARAGAPYAPVPDITWNGDKPEINNPFTSVEQALLRMGASGNERLPGGWLRPHAGQNGGRGGTGGRPAS